MKCSKELKSSIIGRVVDRQEKSVLQVSKETGISSATIYKWVQKHKSGKLEQDSSGALT